MGPSRAPHHDPVFGGNLVRRAGPDGRGRRGRQRPRGARSLRRDAPDDDGGRGRRRRGPDAHGDHDRGSPVTRDLYAGRRRAGRKAQLVRAAGPRGAAGVAGRSRHDRSGARPPTSSRGAWGGLSGPGVLDRIDAERGANVLQRGSPDQRHELCHECIHGRVNLRIDAHRGLASHDSVAFVNGPRRTIARGAVVCGSERVASNSILAPRTGSAGEGCAEDSWRNFPRAALGCAPTMAEPNRADEQTGPEDDAETSAEPRPIAEAPQPAARAAAAPSRPPRVIDMRRPRPPAEQPLGASGGSPGAPRVEPARPRQARPVDSRPPMPRRPERPREAPAPAAPPTPETAPRAEPPRAKAPARPALAAAPAPAVPSPPTPAPVSIPESAWIPPARTVYPRKKKAALTPREALRAKVQARASSSPRQPPSAAEDAAAEASAEETASTLVEDQAQGPAEPPPAKAPQGRASTKVRQDARSAPKPPPRTPAPAPVAEEEPAPARPGFFQRLLGVFRRPKSPKSPRSDAGEER